MSNNDSQVFQGPTGRWTFEGADRVWFKEESAQTAFNEFKAQGQTPVVIPPSQVPPTVPPAPVTTTPTIPVTQDPQFAHLDTAERKALETSQTVIENIAETQDFLISLNATRDELAQATVDANQALTTATAQKDAILAESDKYTAASLASYLESFETFQSGIRSNINQYATQTQLIGTTRTESISRIDELQDWLTGYADWSKAHGETKQFQATVGSLQKDGVLVMAQDQSGFVVGKSYGDLTDAQIGLLADVGVDVNRLRSDHLQIVVPQQEKVDFLTDAGIIELTDEGTFALLKNAASLTAEELRVARDIGFTITQAHIDASTPKSKDVFAKDDDIPTIITSTDAPTPIEIFENALERGDISPGQFEDFVAVLAGEREFEDLELQESTAERDLRIGMITQEQFDAQLDRLPTIATQQSTAELDLELGNITQTEFDNQIATLAVLASGNVRVNGVLISKLDDIDIADLQLEIAEIRDTTSSISQALKDVTGLETQILESQTEIAAIQEIFKEQEIESQVAAALRRTDEALSEALINNPLTRGAAFKPDFNINDIANRLIPLANFPTDAELRAAVAEFGISGARQLFGPTNADEWGARLGLALIEPLIGGAQEATLGISARYGALIGRPETQQLRIIGALATPTLADMAVGYALTKLTITPRARDVLDKIDKWLVEAGDPLFGDAFKIAKTLTQDDVLFIGEMEELGLIPSSQHLGVDGAADLMQLLKMDVRPTASQFEEGLTALRRNAERSIKNDIDARNIITRLEDVIDALRDGFNKSTSLADPQMAARAWEEGLTTAQRLTERIVGDTGRPLFKFEVPFSEAGLTVDQRNALKLLDLKTFINNNEANAIAIKNFIELELSLPSTAGARAITDVMESFERVAYEFGLDGDGLLTLMQESPNLFADGTLLTALLPHISTSEATDVLNTVTDLPNEVIQDTVTRIRDEYAEIPTFTPSGPAGTTVVATFIDDTGNLVSKSSDGSTVVLIDAGAISGGADISGVSGFEITEIIQKLTTDPFDIPLPTDSKGDFPGLYAPPPGMNKTADWWVGIYNKPPWASDFDPLQDIAVPEIGELDDGTIVIPVFTPKLDEKDIPTVIPPGVITDIEEVQDTGIDIDEDIKFDTDQETDTDTAIIEDVKPIEDVGDIQDIGDIQDQPDPDPTEPVPDPEPDPIEDEPDPTPKLRLSKEEKEEREGLETRIMAGPKQKWRVTFDGKNPWIGDARGVVGALSKAQKGRRAKKQADTIIVELVKLSR